MRFDRLRQHIYADDSYHGSVDSNTYMYADDEVHSEDSSYND